jgi:hypothetical protein
MSLTTFITQIGAAGAGGDSTIAYVPVVNALVAFDCSDPTNLVELGRITDTTYLVNLRCVVVDVTAQVAYVNGNSYLTSIDISDPTNMSILDNFADADDAFGMALDTANSNLYVVAQNTITLQCIDVSNPSSLSETSILFDANLDNARALALDLSTDTLYVGAYDHFISYDVSNPSSITRLDSHDTGYFNHYGIGLDTANNVAYVSSYGGDRILSINISNPSSMSNLDNYTQTELDGAYGVSLDLDSNVAYVASERENAVVSVDISNSSNMSGLDELKDNTNFAYANSTAIDVANSVLYVVAGNADTLSSIDISSPSSLSRLDTFTFPTENLLSGLALNIDGPNATNAWE